MTITGAVSRYIGAVSIQAVNEPEISAAFGALAGLGIALGLILFRHERVQEVVQEELPLVTQV